jgi:rhamnogalacturonyl hydrolase YesR
MEMMDRSHAVLWGRRNGWALMSLADNSSEQLSLPTNLDAPGPAATEHKQ